MAKAKQKLFIIPEEPPINEHGLVIPPDTSLCTPASCASCPYQNCFEDNHHLYWEANLYTTKTFKGLRTAPFIIKICRRVHDELHAFQLPPRKPTAEVARLAVAQSGIETRIAAKYDSVMQKRSQRVRSKAKKLRRLDLDIEKLLNEVDELKEQKSLLFGNAGGVLPTERYYIVREGEVELVDTPTL